MTQMTTQFIQKPFPQEQSQIEHIFNQDEAEVKIAKSIFTYREKVFVNGKIVSSQFNFGKVARHDFDLNGKQYCFNTQTDLSLSSPWFFTLCCRDTKLSRVKFFDTHNSYCFTPFIVWVAVFSTLMLGVAL